MEKELEEHQANSDPKAQDQSLGQPGPFRKITSEERGGKKKFNSF